MFKYIRLRHRVKEHLKEFYHRNALGDYVHPDGNHIVHKELIPVITAMLMTRNYRIKSITATDIDYEIRSWRTNYYCNPVSRRQYKHNMKRVRNHVYQQSIPEHQDDSLMFDDLAYLVRYLPASVSDAELQSLLQDVFDHQIDIQKRIAQLPSTKINK